MESAYTKRLAGNNNSHVDQDVPPSFVEGVVDENGHVQHLPGFEVHEKVPEDRPINQDDIESNQNESLFNYEVQNGSSDVEFSQPIMVTGMYLKTAINLWFLNDPGECDNVSYSKLPPTFSDLLGMEGTYRFCIRFTFNGSKKTVLTPNFSVASVDIGTVEDEFASLPTPEEAPITAPEPAEQEDAAAPEELVEVAPEPLGFYLSFDGGDNTYVNSDGIVKNDVFLQNGATRVDHGDSKAIMFDGVDDFISMSDSAFINLTSVENRTIELSFHANDPTTMSPQVLFEAGNQVDGINIYISDSTIFAGIWSDTSNTETNGFSDGFFVSYKGIEANKWYDLQFKINSSESSMQLLLDGVMVASRTDVSEVLPVHGGNIALGGVTQGTQFEDISEVTGAGHYFSGMIDNFAIMDGDACYDTDFDGLCYQDDPCPEDHYNDHDGDGVCGLEGICQLDSYTLPAATDSSRIQYKDDAIIFTGSSSNFIKTSPGSEITLNFNWHVDNTVGYCPGCVVQAYIGFSGVGESPNCFNSAFGMGSPGYGYPNFGGSPTSASLTAPSTPGIYFISHAHTLDYSCLASTNVSLNPRSYMGVVCVE